MSATVAAPASAWRLLLPDGQQVALRPEGTRLGREQGSAEVLLASGKVSRTHAVVWLDAEGNPWVRDLGSANGTTVDGDRITERRLHDGALLTLGDVQLRVARVLPPEPAVARAAAGEPALVFGDGPTAWARTTDLPSASPVFDREAAMPLAPSASGEPAFAELDEGASSGLGKVTVLTAILLLGAIVFFDISAGKVQKEISELETKSDLVTNRSEAMRLRDTHHLVQAGELLPQALALCNAGQQPLQVEFLTGAAPVANPVPGGHVIEPFDSRLAKFNCKVAPLALAPGAKLGVAEIQAAWGAACKLPATAYFLGAGGRAGASEWTAAQLLTKQAPCLRLP